MGDVVEGTAADDAGILPGDVIVAVDGKPLENSLELSTSIATRKPGDRIRLTLNREGKEKTVTVRLGEAEPDETSSSSTRVRPDRGDGRLTDDLKLSYRDLTPELARRYGIDEEIEGVLITDVDPSSDAFRDANLRRGQIIIAIDGETVSSSAELERFYEKIDPGSAFLLRVVQPDGKATMVTALTKPE